MVGTSYASLRFKFDAFENLPETVGTPVSSDEVTDCHGNIWSVDLYPGGQTKSSSGVENDITLFIFNRGEYTVEGKVSFIVRDAFGAAYCQDCGDDINVFVQTKGFGFDLPIPRSQIIDKENKILLDGAFIGDAELQIVNNEQDDYEPCNQHVKNMLALLDSGDDSDDCNACPQVDTEGECTDTI